MPLVHTAVLSYTHTKSCFLCVPKSIVTSNLSFKGLHIFKVEYGKGQRAYFSCSNDSAADSPDNLIKLSGKYALSLGIKDNEPVLIQQIERCSVQVERMYLEPLDPDDWEVMQLNANLIEIELLRQIRVVWKDQVFPVWVNKVFFLAKVAELVPEAEPALLVEWSLIHIVPKEREGPKSPGIPTSLNKNSTNIYKQFDHLRKNHKNSLTHNQSAASGASDELDSCSNQEKNESEMSLQPSMGGFSLFRFLMKSTFPSESSGIDMSDSSESFHPLSLSFVLRVISCSKGATDSNLPPVLRATTVYISARTFLSHCQYNKPQWDAIPLCFVARLSKVQSPQQRKDLAEMNTKSSKGDSNESDAEAENLQQKFSSMWVNVVVLKSSNEEFNVPEALFYSKDAIAVPLELKRRLSLELTSLATVQGVDIPPSNFDSVCLHPMEKMHTALDDNLVITEFQKWARGGNLNESSVILCDGNLLKLPVNSKGKVIDFIMTLQHSESSNSQSSLQSPSSSSNSDKSIISSTVPCYGYLNEAKLRGITVKIAPYASRMKKAMWVPRASHTKVENLYQSVPHLSLDALGGIKEICDTAYNEIERWFKLDPMYHFGDVPYFKFCSSMLIHGPKGVGKSAVIHGLCKKLVNYPHFIYTNVIKCLPLRGKRIDAIVRKWELCFSECVHRQPSLLVFDDLDHLASSCTSIELESGPDGVYYKNLAQFFAGFVSQLIVDKLNIVIIATSKSLHSLHSILTATKGCRVFQTMLEMKLPNAEQRIEILQSLILSKLHISRESLNSLPWKEIATKTEGTVAQDLAALLDKASHAALVRTKGENANNGQVLLVQEDFESAFSGYTPSTLRGLQLHKRNGKTWRDVGGLSEVKTKIQQILTWPVKYSVLFEKCGLRPPCNILLYGAPGTGKTLIASVVASECDMNFISIKGPELLSKYIGASEQAVRDLFKRAVVAKPCILFFDEFDALVPRRGHDSTGVTDRVVNQFLTQMDGVESLDGVYVLAATSRPELIDPALLRPGRLDKCLHCPLPVEKDRVEILKALSQKLSLAGDVDFEAIATMTENFSGADLQALLYSAQVKAFRQCEKKELRTNSPNEVNMSEILEKVVYIPSLEKEPLSVAEMESTKVIDELEMFLFNMDSQQRPRKQSTISVSIELKHLLDVLCDMKPSVSEAERKRYMTMFEQFHHAPKANFDDNDKDALLRELKRVTLA